MLKIKKKKIINLLLFLIGFYISIKKPKFVTYSTSLEGSFNKGSNDQIIVGILNANNSSLSSIETWGKEIDGKINKKSSNHFESFIENKYYGIEELALSKMDSKLRSWIVTNIKNVQISNDSNCTASSLEPKKGYIRDREPAGFDLIIKSKLNCQDKESSEKENNFL
ncbi:hypothetical protein BpHYR1_051650, partial [Brachionus plicatilis]